MRAARLAVGAAKLFSNQLFGLAFEIAMNYLHFAPCCWSPGRTGDVENAKAAPQPGGFLLGGAT
jgi:hypothetical protein